ncbi:glycosyltransferase family 4 protein [Vibrio cholerae]
MKLVFFCNDISFFLNHFTTLLRKTIEQGYDVTLLVGGSNDKSIDIIRKYNVTVIPINITRSGVSIFSETMVFFEIFRILNNIRPDVLHLFTIKPCIYGGIIARLLGLKSTISTITGLGYVFSGHGFCARARSRFFIGLYRLAFGFGNDNVKLVFENSDDRNYFIENKVVNEKNTRRVWGAGVNLDFFSPDDKDKNGTRLNVVTVMLPARMLKDKGVVEFVEAAKIIKCLQIPIEMVLVGGVDPHNPASFTEQELRTYVDMGIIQWKGFQSDMPMQLRSADIICLPSYREGMPKVLLEAMACGKPIITTDVPGCREVIVNEVHGLLVPVRNSHALADTIIKIASSWNIIHTMGKNSRQYALELFSDIDIAEEYISLYGNSNV